MSQEQSTMIEESKPLKHRIVETVGAFLFFGVFAIPIALLVLDYFNVIDLDNVTGLGDFFMKLYFATALPMLGIGLGMAGMYSREDSSGHSRDTPGADGSSAACGDGGGACF